MKYLHSLNILHRDLKQANIFLDEHLYPKIGIFGLSKQEKSDNEGKNKAHYLGTVTHMAPEIFYGKYTKAGDVYAFSIIMYEILTLEKRLNAVRPDIPDSIGSCYQKLINSCWARNPDDRFSFEQITYILKNDASFTNKKVDKSKFNQYIKIVEDFQIDFYSKIRQSKLDDLLQKKKMRYFK